MTIDVSQIRLNTETLDKKIFSDIAKKAASDLEDAKDEATKDTLDSSTQIRRFYDEFVMWFDKVNRPTSMKEKEEELRRNMPYIQMIRAKVAYAKGRGYIKKKKRYTLISPEFEYLINHILDQIDDFNSFRNAKLFFEAFIGFRRAINNN